ncbi:MAG: BamA/TamA family outer membrane protein [Cellvibrionaceae bacterium]|nr:BamA/TamA family outer membrane protein [Cellvibrionaceae bacterium]
MRLSSVLLLLWVSLESSTVLSQTIDFSNDSHREILLPAIEKARKNYRNHSHNTRIEASPSTRAKAEKKRLEALLRSEGFYQGQIAIVTAGNDVSFVIDAGTPYRIKHIGVESPDAIKLPDAAQIPLQINQRLRADAVLAAQTIISDAIAKENCLYQVEVNYKVAVNPDDHTADVRFHVTPSEQVRYGAISTTGLSQLDADYVRHLITLTPGQCFRRSAIDAQVLALFQSNLFSRIDPQISEPAQGEVAVNFALKERDFRTLKTGLGYGTDTGSRVSLAWEHRNIHGRGEKLALSSKVAEASSELAVTLTLPTFLSSPRQSLLMDGKLTRERSDAFDSRALQASATYSRRIKQQLTGNLGLRYRRTSIDSNGSTSNFALLGLPFSLTFDGRGQPLNPVNGERIGIHIEPLIDTLNTKTRFYKLGFSATHYRTARNAWLQPGLALRLNLGSIQGSETASVPADERYYAGGGGSIRGYAYQSVGPQSGASHLGGRSLIELSGETRLRVNQSWGGALFIDGGNVFETARPKDWQDLAWSWGLGVRYFTRFAPIRLDIAFPIDNSADDNTTFQLYISLGQAF